jgi:aspartyl protease family protein
MHMRWFAAHLSFGLALCTANASAAQIQVIALTNGKATLVVNASKPRTLAAGQMSPEGVRLVSATSESAVVEFEGRQHTLTLGTSYRSAGADSPSGAIGRSVVITGDTQGHYLVSGMINGVASVRFLVDTGASLVAISADDAKRAGIDYLSGQRALTQTASGVTTVYRVKLDTIKIGDVVLYNVDAAVHAGGRLPIALLGMSFLNRMDIRRDAQSLTLTRRY